MEQNREDSGRSERVEPGQNGKSNEKQARANDSLDDRDKRRRILQCLGNLNALNKVQGALFSALRFIVGEKSVEVPTRIYASSIVHDAYHSKLYNDALHNGSSKAEALEVSTGREAELACVKVQGESLAKTTGFLPFRLLDWLNLTFSGHRRYEEIPYEDRYW